ncbi:YciI family protein [Entomohabitans teleogrylli]|uniref:YciI family protein n=1 Tax=Entomohabitans teleogrylli TaxID=1384589 RepID=UPI00073DA53B|nr:YciI family protein [Entomohabitans teleogrylli]
MYFVVFATDKPAQEALRARIRPAHRVYLRQHPHPVRVVLGGPTLRAQSREMNGTLLVIEAASQEQVDTFLQDDPYVQAGIFAEIIVRPWLWGIGAPQEV